MRTQFMAIALAVVLSPVAAWGQSFGSFNFSPAPGTGSFTTTVTGNFDDDGLADVAYLRGSEATLVFGPDIYGATAPYPPVASAIAVLPADTGRDELLIADTTGLQAWTRTSRSLFVARSIGGAAWADARALAVSPNGTTIYGLSANGTQLGVKQDFTETWYTLPTPGTDLVVVDWDVDGEDDLAIATASGLDIVANSGAHLANFWSPNPVADLAVVLEAGGPDRVAFVGKGIGSVDDWIVTVGNGVAPWLVILGDLDVVGIASGDTDGDGDDDLVVSRQSDQSLLFLRNGGAFTLTDSETIAARQTASSPTNYHTPVLVDTDRDGDLDLVRMLQETDECLVHENTTVDADTLKPTVVEVSYVVQGSTGYLCFELAAPAGGVPAGATHLEVVMWEMPDPLGPNPTTGSRSVAHTSEVPLALGGGSHYVSFAVPVSSSGDLTSLLFWGARYVDGDPATRTYNSVLPMALHGFTSQVDDPLTPSPLVGILSAASGAGPITLTYAPESWEYPLFGIPMPPVGTGIDPNETGSNTQVQPTPGSNQLPNPGT